MTMTQTKTRKRAILAGLFVILLSSVAACGGGEAGGTKQVNIALVVPLSGANASVGEQSRNAAQLAVDDINAKGGIKSLEGAKVNLVVADSTNDPQGARDTMERVLSQSEVSGVFGLDLSPLCAAALPVVVRKHVPVVSACISDKLVTADNGGYFFQIAPKGSAFGDMQVKFLEFLNKEYGMGITKAAILYVDNPYGQSTEQGIEDLAKKAGLSVVLKSAYPENITDASPLVANIQRSGAQVIFPVSYISDSELILSALRTAGNRALVVGGGAGFIWPPIGKALGDKVDGLTSVSSWNLTSKNVTSDPTLVDVTKRYQQKYDTFMPEQAGEAYAGIWALAEAANQAKSADAKKVREALATMDLKSGGATMMQPGEVKFDSNGANEKVSPVMIQWQHGVPQTVYPPELATAALQKP